MKKEQLEKINCLLSRIAELEKVLSIKSDKIRISEYKNIQYRQIESVAISNEVVIDREILETAFAGYINQAKAELKELGYEE